MSKTPSVPGTDRPADKAAGHWLLAQLGKKVLRPGGRETTNWLLARALGGDIDVVEFAPGLGITALEIVKRSPKSYTGVDLDPKAAEIVTERIGASTKPNYRVVNASAQETGLPSESYDAVVGEAMLTMQTDKHKLEIMREAARLLRPGGYYAIHEMSLVPDYLRPELKEEIQKDLARTIRVNARPLTVAEWTALAEEAGFEVLDVYQTDMALLEPKRLLADEGPAGVAKIAFNLARKPQIRERVLGMRGVFRRHADHVGAIGLILRKK